MQAKVGEDKMVDQLKEAIAAAEVSLITALGQQFASFLKPTPEAHYAKLVGKAGARQLKQDFRMKWAQTQLKSRCFERKTKSEIMKETWGEDGTYMTFDRIVINEG